MSFSGKNTNKTKNDYGKSFPAIPNPFFVSATQWKNYQGELSVFDYKETINQKLDVRM